MATDAKTEKCLFERYHKNRSIENRNAIVEAFLPIVKHQAKKMVAWMPQSVDLEDLVSYGVLGLIESIDTFDSSRGIGFVTFCICRIRGSILDELRDLDWLSRSRRNKVNQYIRAVDFLMDQLGRTPDDSEVADFLGIGMDALITRMAEARLARVDSLDHVFAISEYGRPVNRYVTSDGQDHTAQPPDTRAIAVDEWTFLLRGCSKIERIFLNSYYRDNLTMKQIATSVGVSESRISQIHSALLVRLRDRLESRLEENF